MKGFTAFTGNWREEETKPAGRYEMNFRSKPAGKAGTFTFTPYLFRSGYYDVYYWSPKDPDAQSKVPVQIGTAKGVEHIFIDEQQSGAWVRIGRYLLEKGRKSFLTIIGEGNSYVTADAIRFQFINN